MPICDGKTKKLNLETQKTSINKIERTNFDES